MSSDEALSVEQFLLDWAERDRLRADFLKETMNYAALICPVCAIPAFVHGERNWTIDGIEVGYLDVIQTMWVSILNLPALSLPVGRSPENLPIGVQLVGRPFEDEMLLEIATYIEAEHGEWSPPPGLE
jgi:Asp-tRNA(Asn)/Glu-tRNA(Gln) amidotransferase A subunit family amidase